MTEQTGAGTPTTVVPPPPGIHLITADLVGLTDEQLHTALTELRDAHQQNVDFYTKWLNVVRARVAKGRSEQAAANAIGVSRATVRKATGKKKP